METNLYEKSQPARAPQKTKATSKKRSWVWLVLGLILLSAIPLAGGAFRLIQLSNGAEITPDNARSLPRPCPWCCTSWVPVSMPSWARSSS